MMCYQQPSKRTKGNIRITTEGWHSIASFVKWRVMIWQCDTSGKSVMDYCLRFADYGMGIVRLPGTKISFLFELSMLCPIKFDFRNMTAFYEWIMKAMFGGRDDIYP